METKDVWVVESNTDLIEGRGKPVRLAFCETYATAKRLAAGKYVQGGDCPVSKCEVFKPEGRDVWFGPVTIEAPSTQDNANQSILDAQDEALERARSLGLSDKDIRLIQRAQ